MLIVCHAGGLLAWHLESAATVRQVLCASFTKLDVRRRFVVSLRDTNFLRGGLPWVETHGYGCFIAMRWNPFDLEHNHALTACLVQFKKLAWQSLRILLWAVRTLWYLLESMVAFFG